MIMTLSKANLFTFSSMDNKYRLEIEWSIVIVNELLKMIKEKEKNDHLNKPWFLMRYSHKYEVDPLKDIFHIHIAKVDQVKL